MSFHGAKVIFKLRSIFGYLFQHISIGTFTTIGIFLDIGPLQFRRKTRHAVNAFFESKEILQNGSAPDFSGDAAEHARRIRQSPFSGKAAFGFFLGHQFHVTADKF